MAADEVYEFAVTVPAGTLITAPQTTSTQFDARIVDRIEWHIPPGALGVVGFFISMRGVRVLPRGVGTWIIRSGVSGAWALRGQPDSGDWSVTAYNTGANPHTVYVTHHTRVIRPAASPLTADTPDDLSDYPHMGAIRPYDLLPGIAGYGYGD